MNTRRGKRAPLIDPAGEIAGLVGEAYPES